MYYNIGLILSTITLVLLLIAPKYHQYRNWIFKNTEVLIDESNIIKFHKKYAGVYIVILFTIFLFYPVLFLILLLTWLDDIRE